MPCGALQDACKGSPAAAQQPQQNAAGRVQALQDATQALGDTLGLAQRLFCALEPADGSPGGGGSGGDAGSNVQALLASQRKREVSAWLEEQAGPEVTAAVQEVCSVLYHPSGIVLSDIQ